jgi:hypothetical protein
MIRSFLGYETFTTAVSELWPTRSTLANRSEKPFVEFRSGSSRQFSNLTYRKSVGIIVDADLVATIRLVVHQVCGFDPFLRSQ